MNFIDPPNFSRKTTSRLRRRFHAADPTCHWCKVVTVLYNVPDGQKPSDDCATIDHVKDRLQCLSPAEHRAPSNVVLACYKCNYGRAVKLDRERLDEKRRLFAERQAAIANPLVDLSQALEASVLWTEGVR